MARVEAFDDVPSHIELPPLPDIDENTKLNICVLGGGSFATALATIAARRGHTIKMVVRFDWQAISINTKHINNELEWLKEHQLLPNITATTKIEEAMQTTPHLIIYALPTQITPKYLSSVAHFIPTHIPFVCCAKGIHLASESLLCDIVPKQLKRSDPLNDRVCYLSGPSFAKEMMIKHPITLVCAAHSIVWCKFVQTALRSLYFRIYYTTDIVGVECGGALKNPLAIGAGIAAGLGYGKSSIAAIITRGAVEMQRLAMAMGCENPNTLFGLSGFGDLMLTANSEMSRNRTCGYLIGSEGLTTKEAEERVGETVEGVATAFVAQKLMNRYGLRMPLFDALADVLKGTLDPKEALERINNNKAEDEGFVTVFRHSVSNDKMAYVTTDDNKVNEVD
eukprot:305958_1